MKGGGERKGERSRRYLYLKLICFNVHLDRVRRIQERRWRAEEMRRSMLTRMNAELVRPGQKIFGFLIRHHKCLWNCKFIYTLCSQITCVFIILKLELIKAHQSGPQQALQGANRVVLHPWVKKEFQWTAVCRFWSQILKQQNSGLTSSRWWDQTLWSNWTPPGWI